MKVKSVPVLVSLVTLAGCATSGGQAPQSIATVQPTDSEMSCDMLVVQLAELDQVMIDNAPAGDPNLAANVADAAMDQGVAVAATRVPGLGPAMSLFNGAKAMNQQQTAQQKAETYKDAEMRRVHLTGLAAGKGCDMDAAGEESATAPENEV